MSLIARDRQLTDGSQALRLACCCGCDFPVRSGARRRGLGLKRWLPFVPPVLRGVSRVRGQVEMWREYTPDRHVLEEVIFAALLARSDMQAPALRRL